MEGSSYREAVEIVLSSGVLVAMSGNAEEPGLNKVSLAAARDDLNLGELSSHRSRLGYS
jgi:hypothetical protein